MSTETESGIYRPAKETSDAHSTAPDHIGFSTNENDDDDEMLIVGKKMFRRHLENRIQTQLQFKITFDVFYSFGCV